MQEDHELQPEHKDFNRDLSAEGKGDPARSLPAIALPRSHQDQEIVLHACPSLCRGVPHRALWACCSPGDDELSVGKPVSPHLCSSRSPAQSVGLTDVC